VGSTRGGEGHLLSDCVKIDGDSVEKQTIRFTSFQAESNSSKIDKIKEEIAMLLILVKRLQLDESSH
jgi:hypothetical protein